jgi:hypothetical protein
VNRLWRESYKTVATVQMAGLLHDYEEQAVMCTITPETTLYSAAFASAASVRLAHECGLMFDYCKKLERIAGRCADVSTLQAAQELELEFTRAVLFGAAEAGSVQKLNWLHTQQGCPLPANICSPAARSGSMDVLRWLKGHGCVFGASTCASAAAGAHLHVLRYLRDEGCEWGVQSCTSAIKHGHLSTLEWLHEQGCPWHRPEICGDAAYRGSIEMLLYLQQRGGEFNANTMVCAATQGHLAVCQFLVAEQCPCDAQACAEAAAHGHLETVRFLHESGCPWNADTICARAAESGNVELLRYLRQQQCIFGAGAMSAAARKGLTHICLYLRAEQCPWDTRACEAAASNGHVDTLRWLSEQGCPYDAHDVRVAAVEGGFFEGYVSVLNFAQNLEPAPTAAQLTHLLNLAAARSKLATAQWLRKQGAEWPAVLNYYESPWSDDVLQWAREEGCTSPTSATDV